MGFLSLAGPSERRFFLKISPDRYFDYIVDSAAYLQSCRHGTISSMSEAHEFLEIFTATLYRVATYATIHLIDDAAMLSLIFC